MKRIAKRTIVIGAVLTVLAIMVSAAAYGYFISGRTIANNEVSAGSITLTVNDDGVAAPVSISHLMPGDYGTAGNYILKNIGDTHGTLWVGVHGNDNGVDKFFDQGLAEALQVAFWLDADQSGTWTTGDSYFVPDGRYQSFAAGDGPAVPALAYESLWSWQDGWSNTLDVPGASTAGILRMTYSLPASVDDLGLMGKKCNYDMIVELHQYHPDTNQVTVGSLSGHTGVTWTAVSNGVVVDHGSIANGAVNTVLTLPVNSYSIVFEGMSGGNSWTWTKTNVDITVTDFGPFDLPA